MGSNPSGGFNSLLPQQAGYRSVALHFPRGFLVAKGKDPKRAVRIPPVALLYFIIAD